MSDDNPALTTLATIVGLIVLLAIAGTLVYVVMRGDTQKTRYDEETRDALKRVQQAQDEQEQALQRARDQVAQPAPAVPAITYTGWLKDGEQVAWAVPPGIYQVHMTASGDGATLTWVGASCGEARAETSQFETTCVLAAPAQLVISNPCDACLGGSVSVALTVVSRR